MLARVVFEKDRVGEEKCHRGLASVEIRGPRVRLPTREPRVATVGGDCAKLAAARPRFGDGYNRPPLPVRFRISPFL